MRATRMFLFGATSVALMPHLLARGWSEQGVSALIALTLFGDAVVALGLASATERLGRRRVLVVSGLLQVLAFAVFAVAQSPLALVVSALFGILSPSGGEAGPASSVEQAALASLTPEAARPPVYARYAFVGNIAAALGVKVGGLLWANTSTSQVFAVAAAMAAALALLPATVSRAAEAQSIKSAQAKGALALESEGPSASENYASSRTILALCTLFALDSLGSGMVMQSLLSHWFALRFGLGPNGIGSVFLVTNVLAGISTLVAGKLATRIGLVETMVFTHIPANLFLLAIAFAPMLHQGALEVGVGLLFFRFLLAQMDVPARMALTMKIVPESARARTAMLTTVAKSVGGMLGPLITGVLLSGTSGSDGKGVLIGLPLVIAALVKIAYDLGLYWLCRPWRQGLAAVRRR
jgi:MFS family permease